MMNGSHVWMWVALFGVPVYCFLPHNLSVAKGGSHMVEKLLALLFASVLAFPLSTLAFAQEAPAQQKTAKESRWEGVVIRSSADKSTLTVRNGKSIEMTVQYDSSTQWVSQEH